MAGNKKSAKSMKSAKPSTTSKKSKTPTTSVKFTSKKPTTTSMKKSLKAPLSKKPNTTLSFDDIWAQWTQKERGVFDSLTSPRKIQEFLDACKYDAVDGCRSIRTTLVKRETHCLGGSLLACYALQRLGYAAWIVCLNAVNDDSHAICVYGLQNTKNPIFYELPRANNKQNVFFGAISNGVSVLQ